MICYLASGLKATEPSNHGMKPLKSWAKRNFSCFKLIALKNFVTVMQSWLAQNPFFCPLYDHY
jgi:hypothetical protein